MKNWINKNYKTLIIAAFLVPIITVAIVSISHVTTWYGISNPVTWSVYLSIGIEIAALSALAAISANMGSKVYFPFAIVTLVQFIGNIFFAYTYINIDSQQFKDWVDLVSPLVEYMGVEPTDFIGHKRFLAFFAGGMLPVISLSFLHMLVKFTEEDRKKQNEIVEENPKTENTIEASDLVGEVSRLRLSEEDLKKLEEVLLNPPPPNENLVEAAIRYEEKRKKESELSDEDILKKAEEIRHRQILERAEELKKEREEIYLPEEEEEEPTALANSEYRENLDVELVEEEEEIVNDTPISVETKTINLRQVVFEPIENPVQPTKEEQRELLSEIMRLDQELGLYDESLFTEKVEESKEIIENSNAEELLKQYEEEFSTIEPTEEEEQENFSTIEVNSENIFQEEIINEPIEVIYPEFEISVEVIPDLVISNEITEEIPQEPIPTSINSQELVEKKNSL
jgi:hypothetical protein